MQNLKKVFLLLFIAIKAVVLFAQDNKPVEMADTLRSNGKIYIVVAVCLTILIGLFVYVFSVDRKISRLEKSSGN